MNRKKLEIIKKTLGTDSWYLKEDKNLFPDDIFVFNGNGKHIIDYRRRFIYYDYYILFRKSRLSFNFNNIETKQIISLLVKEYFGWEVYELFIGCVGFAHPGVVEQHFNTIIKKTKNHG